MDDMSPSKGPKKFMTDSAIRKNSTNSNNSTDFMSSIHSTSGDRQKEDVKANFSQIMQERWCRANQNLPKPDQTDIMEENPHFNKNKHIANKHQHHPEFTQSSYLRLRSMEEAFAMENYFKNRKKSKDDGGMSVHMRSFGIQKVFDLHMKKEYKEETLFISAAIFDRYVNILGVNNFNKNLTVHLATISVLMSAKLEQPISPSFTRMINLLTSEEK